MNERLAPYWSKLKDLQLYGRKKAPLDRDALPEVVCLNCGTSYHGNYCPNCGQKSKTGRLTFGFALSNLTDILFNTERGFLHTCLDLLYRPGHMIRDYVSGHRVEYTRPIQLLFILTTIYVVLHYLFDHSFASLFDVSAWLDNAISAESQHPTGKKQMLLQIVADFFQNRAYVALFTAVLMVLPSWFVFRRVNESCPVTIAEMFFILIYISSQQLLFSILLLPYDHFSGHESSGFMLPMGLLVWVFHQYFQISWRTAIRRSFLSYLILFVLFVLLLALVAGTLYLCGFDFEQFVESHGGEVIFEDSSI